MEFNELKSVICVLNPDDVYKIKENNDSQYKDNLMTPYEFKKFKEDNVGISFPETIKEGAFLVLSKNKDCYSLIKDIEESEEINISKKVCTIQQIVSYLGGVDFKAEDQFSEESLKNSQKRINGEIGVAAGENSANMSAHWNQETENAQKIYGKAEIESHSIGKYTKNGYDGAVKIAKETGLYNLPMIESILRLRSSDNPNLLQNNTYEVSLNSEFSKKLKVVLGIYASIQTIYPYGGSVKLDIDKEYSEKLYRSGYFKFSTSFGEVCNGDTNSDSLVEDNHIKAIESSIQDLSILVNNLQSITEQMQADCENLDRNTDKANASIQKLEEQIGEAKASISDLENRTVEALTSLQKSIDEEENKCKKLEDRLNSDVSSIKNSLVELNNIIESVKLQNNKNYKKQKLKSALIGIIIGSISVISLVLTLLKINYII